MLTFTWLAIVLLAMLALAYRQCVRSCVERYAWRRASRGLGRALAARLAGCSSSPCHSCCSRSPSMSRSLRRKLVSDVVLAAFRKVLPPMSQTEREAIEAGTVWWDGELFSGTPALAQAARRAGTRAYSPTSSVSSTTRPKSFVRW